MNNWFREGDFFSEYLVYNGKIELPRSATGVCFKSISAQLIKSISVRLLSTKDVKIVLNVTDHGQSILNDILIKFFSITEYIGTGKHSIFHKPNYFYTSIYFDDFFSHMDRRYLPDPALRGLASDAMRLLNYDPDLMLNNPEHLEDVCFQIQFDITKSAVRIAQFMGLLSYIKQQYSSKEIPAELIEEFVNILKFLIFVNHFINASKKDTSLLPDKPFFHYKPLFYFLAKPELVGWPFKDIKNFKHIINTSFLGQSRINPSKQSVSRLLAFLQNCKPDEPYNPEFESLLLSGNNPNESSYGVSPLVFVLSHKLPKEYFSRLVFMGANYSERPAITNMPTEYSQAVFHSAWELARREKDWHLDKIDIMQKKESTLKRAISLSNVTSETPVSSLTKVKSNRFFNAAGMINTVIEYNNKSELITVLKETSQLSQEERKTAFAIFSDHFELTRGTQEERDRRLKDIFFDDLGNCAFVELLYSAGKVIGFNLFDLMHSKTREDYLFLHCAYSAVDKNFRSAGIMSLLAFRLAYAFQCLFPNFHVGVFFISNHFNSFKMMMAHSDDEDAHKIFPMLQPPLMIEFINEFIDTLYEGKITLQHNNFTCFFEEEDPLRVKDNYRSGKPDFNEEFFYNVIQGGKKEEDEPRCTPVAFLVEEHNAKKLDKHCESMGIDFKSHINGLREQLSKFLQVTPAGQKIIREINSFYRHKL